MPRLFFAIDLPREIKEKISPAIISLRELGAHVRPVGRESMHLTMLFLGEQPGNIIPELVSIATQAVSGARPCDVSIGPAGFFPRVSFLTLIGEIETLIMVSRSLSTECAGYLERPEDRPFKAHITIARHKQNIRPQEKARITELFSKYAALAWTCRELVLYESDLTPKGPIYKALERFPFCG
jgi:RNA 2',3'-cyclic 3'-phosphodiesterase